MLIDNYKKEIVVKVCSGNKYRKRFIINRLIYALRKSPLTRAMRPVGPTRRLSTLSFPPLSLSSRSVSATRSFPPLSLFLQHIAAMAAIVVEECCYCLALLQRPPLHANAPRSPRVATPLLHCSSGEAACAVVAVRCIATSAMAAAYCVAASAVIVGAAMERAQGCNGTPPRSLELRRGCNGASPELQWSFAGGSMQRRSGSM